MERWDSLDSVEYPDAGRPDQVNVFSILAYDAVWTVAHALEDVIADEGRTLRVPCLFAVTLLGVGADVIQGLTGQVCGSLTPAILPNHAIIKEKLLAVDFDTALTGRITFDELGDRQNQAYEVSKLAYRLVRS